MSCRSKVSAGGLWLQGVGASNSTPCLIKVTQEKLQTFGHLFPVAGTLSHVDLLQGCAKTLN